MRDLYSEERCMDIARRARLWVESNYGDYTEGHEDAFVNTVTYGVCAWLDDESGSSVREIYAKRRLDRGEAINDFDRAILVAERMIFHEPINMEHVEIYRSMRTRDCQKDIKAIHMLEKAAPQSKEDKILERLSILQNDVDHIPGVD